MRHSFPIRPSITVATLALTGFILFPQFLAANPVEGDSLNIGSNAYAGLGSAVIGDNNYAPDYSSSFLIGSGNWMPNDGGGSLGVGALNFLGGLGNVAFGFGNDILGTSTYSGAFGQGNGVANANRCFAFGASNMIDDAEDSAAFGFGLILNSSSQQQMVVGRYNLQDASGPLFVVGNGTGTAPNQRSNAFVVHQNGTAELGGYPVINAFTFPTYLGSASIALSSADHRSISINASSSDAGKNLTIQAGNSASGSDLGGGALILSGGNSTGNAGSVIEFRTAASSPSGTPTDIRTAETRMSINAAGGIWAGVGLTAGAAPQFILGKYNNDETDISTNPITIRSQGLFIVGAGDANNNRKNALRITPSGTILVQPAGDISMGDFTSGEKP
jgi:hypothetical protein